MFCFGSQRVKSIQAFTVAGLLCGVIQSGLSALPVARQEVLFLKLSFRMGGWDLEKGGGRVLEHLQGSITEGKSRKRSHCAHFKIDATLVNSPSGRTDT